MTQKKEKSNIVFPQSSSYHILDFVSIYPTALDELNLYPKPKREERTNFPYPLAKINMTIMNCNQHFTSSQKQKIQKEISEMLSTFESDDDNNDDYDERA